MKRLAVPFFLFPVVSMGWIEGGLRAVPETEAQPRGALSGTSIFVSAGHGWENLNDQGRWVTQRALVNGVIEDHSNAETVNQYLLPYLWNAGARVYTSRERDMNTNMVIVEPMADGFRRRGDWRWELNPQAYGGMQLITEGRRPPTAEARYTPEIPEAGRYAVYYWWAPAIEGTSSTEAKIRINHAGGSTVWLQDLNRDAVTWKYLGHYWFDRGASEASGSVLIENISQTPSDKIVAGTVRFGGGMGDVESRGSISGKPRWEESGYLYAQFAGYDPSQDSRPFNTVSAMPMFAEWEAEDWELGRSVYISWHSNASGQGAGSTARGFFSFVYGPESWGGLDLFTGFPGGIELVEATHDAIMADVHSVFSPNWRNGPKVTRWLGETNPRNNNRMPATVLEYGFFDNVEDAAYIVDPQFRISVSRGTYAGLVHYFADHVAGFTNRTILPEPVRNFSIEIGENNEVTLRWEPGPTDQDAVAFGPAPTEYRVYHSTHGRAFDNGALTENTSVTLRSLTPGVTHYFRVAARNEGGESWPSDTLTVRLEEGPRVLLVNGFNRLDRGLNRDVNGYQAGILDRMNRRDYLVDHARALGRLGIAFDSVNRTALENRESLDRYAAVIWAAGREAGENVLTETERSLLRGFHDEGGSIFLSGTNVAEGLSLTGDGREFLRSVFGASFVRAGAPGTSLVAAMGLDPGIDAVMRFDDGLGHCYDAREADVIAPMDGARMLIAFDADLRAPAVISNQRASARTVLSSVPFETVVGEESRERLMEAVVSYLLGR